MCRATVGSAVIELCQGSLTEEACDVIVCSSNPNLQLAGSLGLDLLHNGGSAIQTECTQHMRTSGPLQPGKAVCLTAGSLPSKAIVHTVMPHHGVQGEQEVHELAMAILNSMTAAVQHSAQTIALPAFTCEASPQDKRVPAEIVLSNLLQAMHSLPLNSIRIMDTDKSAIDVYSTVFCSLFGTSAKISRPKPTGSTLTVSLPVAAPVSSCAASSLGSAEMSPQVASKVASPATPSSSSSSSPLKSLFGGFLGGLFGSSSSGRSSAANKWVWQDDDGSWKPYSPADAAQLIKAESSNDSSCPLTIRGQRYLVDFKAGLQTNMATGNQRHVKRGSSTTSSGQTAASPTWHFRDDKGSLTEYDAVSSRALEMALTAHPPQCQLTHGKWTYIIDLTTMKQKNLATGKERDVIRKPPLNPIQLPASQPVAAATAAPAQAEPVVIEGDSDLPPSVVVQLEGLAVNIHRAHTKLGSILQGSIIAEVVAVPTGMTDALKTKLAKIGRKNGVELELRDGSASSVAPSFSMARAPRARSGGSVTIRGVRRKVKKCVREVQGVIIERTAAASDESELQLPEEWEPQADDLELMEVTNCIGKFRTVSAVYKICMLRKPR